MEVGDGGKALGVKGRQPKGRPPDVKLEHEKKQGGRFRAEGGRGCRTGKARGFLRAGQDSSMLRARAEEAGCAVGQG